MERLLQQLRDKFERLAEVRATLFEMYQHTKHSSNLSLKNINACIETSEASEQASSNACSFSPQYSTIKRK